MIETTKQPFLITIIIAVRNGEATLERALCSIVSQDYSPVELIVIDGGSDDGTVELIRRHDNTISYWETEADRGVCHAWNKALDHVHGEWILFIGADDYLWDNNVLNQVARDLFSVPDNIQAAYGRVSVVSSSGALLGEYGEPWKIVCKRFRQEMAIPHQGVFHRASLFSVCGKFDESYRISGDYELLLRALPHHAPLFLPFMITGMQTGGISSLHDNAICTLKEAGRACKIHGFSGFRFRWRWNLTKAYIRKFLERTFGKNVAVWLTIIYRAITKKNVSKAQNLFNIRCANKGNEERL